MPTALFKLREEERKLIKFRSIFGRKLIKNEFSCMRTELSALYVVSYLIIELSIYRKTHFEFRYDSGDLSSISNFDTIFDKSTILYEFRYVRKFRYEMHVLNLHERAS